VPDQKEERSVKRVTREGTAMNANVGGGRIAKEKKIW